MKKRLVVFFACACSVFLVVLILIVIFPAPIINLYIGNIEKRLNVNIDFSLKDASLLKEWSFNRVKVSSKRGYTLTIDSLTLYPPFYSLREGQININSKAQNLRFQKKLPLLDAACGLLSIQPLKDIIFDRVDVHVKVKGGKVKMENLNLASKSVKIFGAGVVDTETRLMECSLKFLFSESITSNVNEIVRLAMLKEEEPPWMSLNIKVSGDYRRPHLSLSNNLLNLNIQGIRLK